MLPKFRRLVLVRAARVLDVTIVALTFIAALVITSSSLTWPSVSEVLILRIKIVNLGLFAGYLLFCSAVFSMCGVYLSHRLSPWNRQAREIVVGVTLMTTPLVLFQWPFRFDFATWEFMLCYWMMSAVGLLLVRMSGRALLTILRKQGKNLRTIVIVGQSSEANALANRLARDTSLGYRVVDVIDVKEERQ